MRHSTEFILIAAKDRAGGIGLGNALQVRIPDDLARFKALTQGEVVVMGRKTWESLPANKLPGRIVWVISRGSNSTGMRKADKVFSSIEDFLIECQTKDLQRVFVAGGGELFNRIIELDLASAMEITEVDEVMPSDCHFPSFDEKRWLCSRTEWRVCAKSGLSYRFASYVSK